MALETYSDAAAYTTKPNVVVPLLDQRTIAKLVEAATNESVLRHVAHGDGRSSRSTAALAGTALVASAVPVLGNVVTITAIEADDNLWASTGHALAVNDVIRLLSKTGGTGLSIDTNYWVITVDSANSFSVSASAPDAYGTPGAVVNITVDATAATYIKIGDESTSARDYTGPAEELA